MLPREQFEAMQEYCNTILRLKQQCINEGMTDEEFMNLFDYVVNEANREREDISNESRIPPPHTTFTFRRKLCVAAIIFFCLGVSFVFVANNHQTIYKCLACNLQDYLYPGLRLLRKLFIPIISSFPSLTTLYQESCLVKNPVYVVSDMDCWPCSTVANIFEDYKPSPVYEQHRPPFIYKTEQEVVTTSKLEDYYLNNKKIFDEDAPVVLADKKHFIFPSDMFYQHDSGEKRTYVWRFTVMNVAKLLRQLIPRPEVVPRFGQSTERFLIVDTSQRQFRIPDTECSFSFLLSLSGSRTIELRPAEECKHQCKSLKIDLKQTYLLWYNWWYWRPVVQSASGNTTFIAHVGSYC